MYFHFHCDDQGYDLLAGLFKRTAIEEILHIEKPAERIIFLKGDVEMENLRKFGENYLALQSIERSKNIAAGRPVD
jgi:bacterioferritin